MGQVCETSVLTAQVCVSVVAMLLLTHKRNVTPAMIVAHDWQARNSMFMQLLSLLVPVGTQKGFHERE